MYPSVTFSLKQRAITCYTHHLDLELQQKIANCLNLIKFGMSKTLLQFRGIYFEYIGGGNKDDKGLAIGGYESSFLADLVASFLLECTNKKFFDHLTVHHGIYCDYGLASFKGKISEDNILHWLGHFQTAINILTGGTFLQFTVVLWDVDGISKSVDNKFKICTDTAFPGLDYGIGFNGGIGLDGGIGLVGAVDLNMDRLDHGVGLGVRVSVGVIIDGTIDGFKVGVAWGVGVNVTKSLMFLVFCTTGNFPIMMNHFPLDFCVWQKLAIPVSGYRCPVSSVW